MLHSGASAHMSTRAQQFKAIPAETPLCRNLFGTTVPRFAPGREAIHIMPGLAQRCLADSGPVALRA
eukprot:8243563-Alexandrium_andersonii.AAC.1